jgi:hypothetical protein
MPHFAELNESNEVIYITYMSDKVITDENGVEQEQMGIDHLHTHHGADRTWVRTSYHGNFRGNYAGIGYTYMTDVATLGVGSTDVFVPQQPYSSWTIDTTVAEWKSPLGDAPELTDEQIAADLCYVWDENAYQADNTTGWTLSSI